MPNKFNLPEPITFKRTTPKDPKRIINTKPRLNVVDKNGNPQKPLGVIASQRVRTEGVLTSVYLNSINEWSEDTGVSKEEYALSKLNEFLTETRRGIKGQEKK
jgi:hypothetical protein